MVNRSSYGLYFVYSTIGLTHNPIFVLAIIAISCSPFLKAQRLKMLMSMKPQVLKKTWEDMEREYGISIERKNRRTSGLMLHLMMLAISRLVLRFLIINLQNNLKESNLNN